MAKFMILFFLTAGTASVSYLTYTGTGQEKIETISKEKTARSNSSHGAGGYWSGSRSSGGSYNGSGYSYGK